MCKFLLKMKLRSTYLVWIFLILHSEGQSQIPEKTKREASPYKRPVDVTTSDAARICKEKGLPYYNGASNHSCCGCPAGEYRTGDCPVNKLEETPCVPCTNNRTIQTFTSNPNALTSCNISQSPQACESLMYTKFKRGNQTTDNRCVCVYGTYPKNFDSNVYGCIPHTKCKTAFGVKVDGNETNDVECEKCQPGMCSNETSATARCKPCGKVTINMTNSVTKEIVDPTTSPPSQTSPQNEAPPAPLEWYWIVFIIVTLVLSIIIVGLLCYRLGRRQGNGHSRYHGNGHALYSGNMEMNNINPPGDAPGNNAPEGPSASMNNEDSVNTVNEEREPLVRRNKTGNAGAETSCLENQSLDDNEVPTTQTPTVTSTRNFDPSQVMDERLSTSKVEDKVKRSSSQGLDSGEGEVSSAKFTDRSSIQEDKKQSTGVIMEPSESQNCADPFEHMNGESSDRCERRMNRDEYEPLFEGQGYEIRYEPDQGPDNQFIVILMSSGRKPYEEAKNEVEQLRGQIIKHMRENRNIFEPAISRQYGNFEEYLDKLRSHTTPGDEYTLQAAEQLLQKEFKVVKPHDARDDRDHPQHVRFLGLVDNGFYVWLEPSYGNPIDPNSSAQRVSTIDSRVEQQPSSSSNDETQTTRTVTYSETCEEKGAASESKSASTSLDAGFSYKDCFADEQYLERLEEFEEEKVNAELRSNDLANEMLESLVKSDHEAVLKLARSSGFLKNPRGVIQDAKGNFPTNRKEQRRKILEDLEDEQQVKLTPKLLLDRCHENNINPIYSELCDYFVEHIEKKYHDRPIPKKNGQS